MDKWLDSSKHDLDVAFLINRDGGFSDTVCYFCHQTAEKALKALLISQKNLDFPHTHKLTALLEIARKLKPEITFLKQAVSVLDKYYIEAKYPMDFPIEYTRKEAETAINLATEVYDLIEKIINKK